MADIGYITALLAGAISFLSPCVLPLVPPYLVYLAGASLDTLTGDESAAAVDAEMKATARRRAVFHSVLFILGFSCVFIALGASASTIGSLLRQYQQGLSIIAGIIIIVMGLHFLGLFKIGFLHREARFQTKSGGGIGSYLMGVAFAFGWTPCIGPVLGAILALAGARDSVAEGAFMLAIYSAGLGIPFLLAAIFIGPFMSFLSRFKKRLGTVEKATGGLLVLTGVLFLTGGMERTAYWLLEAFPALGALG